MTILIASHNSNKKREIQKILPEGFEIKDLHDIGFKDVIDESGLTLEENALIKVRYLYRNLKIDCIAEDSGLEIDFLNGEPGVHSARYAGNEKNDLKNIEKVLIEMKGISNRSCRFRTVIALVFNGNEYLFEGKIEGTLSNTAKGNYGFGYDPIFIPDSYQNTFAELGDEVKVKISHRSKAMMKLMEFLNAQNMTADHRPPMKKAMKDEL